MLVLGIETSCDETGVALYDTAAGLLAHALHSQVAMHADYGGVVPELASRDHIRRLLPLTRAVLERGRQHGSTTSTRIAYTEGPGLAGALLVGASFAARPRPARSACRRSASITSKATCSRRCCPSRAPRFPVRRAAGLRRPHPAHARRRRRALRAARRDAGRRRRRSLRQDRQAARPGLSRRPGAGAARRERARRALQAAAADARTAATSISASAG